MRRLLFVDDEYNDYLIWGAPLAIDYGWEVDYAKSPREALAKLKKKVYDVIIIDRRMYDAKKREYSVMVGDELLRDVVARWGFVCPIMLTNHPDLDSAQKATRYGAYRYIVKGTEVSELESACRKGIQWQLMRRIRHTLMLSGSIADMVSQVKKEVQEALNPLGFCFAYMRLGPGKALMIEDSECPTPSKRFANALRDECAFLEVFPVAREVVESLRFALRTKRNEITASGGTLLDAPGSQLIVPVPQPEDPSVLVPRKVAALIWIESKDEDAFDKEDADMLSELADYLAAAFAKSSQMAERSGKERGEEREGILAEFARRICNPLQIAQNSLDLTVARLKRGDTLSPRELRGQLKDTLVGIERAIQESFELQSVTEGRVATLKPVDLAALVKDVTRAFRPRAEKASVKISTSVASPIPPVLLDAREMRYTIESMLENAVEAIKNRRSKSRAEPKLGKVTVSLTADRSAKEGAMLCIEDNGCGILPNDQSRIFDRYFTTKTEETRERKLGLGLYEAKRFIDSTGGSIEVVRTTAKGTVFRICLNACAKNAQPTDVVLQAR